MSVFDSKNKEKKAKLAFVDDNSIDTEQTPQSLAELNKSGRGANPSKKGKGGRPKMDKSKKQPKQVIAIHISDEQKAELKARAEKANLSMASYIIVKLFGVD